MSNVYERWHNIMHTVISDVVENLAFMEVEHEHGCEFSIAGCRQVRQYILAPVQGEFRLFMPERLITDVAEAVYGPVFYEVTDRLKNDLLAEILNTFSGRFMAEILPDNESFKLSVPATGEATSKPEGSVHFCFTVEEATFFLLVSGETLLSTGE